MMTALLDLGRIDYLTSHSIMLRLVDLRAEGSIGDVLILAEHDHVITLGRRGREENVLKQAAPVIRVERGGDVTYHGPGMLMIYPIIKLDEKRMSVEGFVRSLEETAILALEDFGLEAERRPGYPGVWAKGRKVASVGIAIRSWVTFHGMAINVSPDMRYFGYIRPCGMSSEVMGSLSELIGRTVTLEEFKPVYLRSFEKVFGDELVPGIAEHIVEGSNLW